MSPNRMYAARAYRSVCPGATALSSEASTSSLQNLSMSGMLTPDPKRLGRDGGGLVRLLLDELDRVHERQQRLADEIAVGLQRVGVEDQRLLLDVDVVVAGVGNDTRAGDDLRSLGHPVAPEEECIDVAAEQGRRRLGGVDVLHSHLADVDPVLLEVLVHEVLGRGPHGGADGLALEILRRFDVLRHHGAQILAGHGEEGHEADLRTLRARRDEDELGDHARVEAARHHRLERRRATLEHLVLGGHAALLHEALLDRDDERGEGGADADAERQLLVGRTPRPHQRQRRDEGREHHECRPSHLSTPPCHLY